jgi:hypothetical protein
MAEPPLSHSDPHGRHIAAVDSSAVPAPFLPRGFASKSDSELRALLKGFSEECLESAFCFRKDGSFESMSKMLPGMIAFHLPQKAPRPPGLLEDHLRLSEDLGLDSLALAEMAFKMDELFGVPIETREVAGIATVGDLKAFLRRKLLQP